MTGLERALRSVANKEVMPTFIGESGVGKEGLARRAHELSPRREAPFEPINCAAIPEALVGSELFRSPRGSKWPQAERVELGDPVGRLTAGPVVMVWGN